MRSWRDIICHQGGASFLMEIDFVVRLARAHDHPPGVWFDERCMQLSIHSDKYDQVISILHFGRNSARSSHFDEAHEEDACDRFSPKARDRF